MAMMDVSRVERAFEQEQFKIVQEYRVDLNKYMK